MENFNKKRSPVRQPRTDITKEEMMHKMMMKKKLKEQISRYKHVEEKPKEGYCPHHNKPNDVYCLTCLEKICTNCALFGSHKVKQSYYPTRRATKSKARRMS